MNKNEPEQSLGFLLHDTARLLRRHFDRRVQALGLTRAQWSVLAHLRRMNGARQTELADILEIQPITLARLLDRLEAKDWIERRSDPTDRRAKKIYLTRKVMPLLERMKKLGRDITAESTRGISDRDITRMMKMLQTLRNNLQNNCAIGEKSQERK